MKRFFAICYAALMLFLAGCSFLAEDERLYVEPYHGIQQQTKDEVVHVETYLQMRQALLAEIKNCSDRLLVSVSSFQDATVDYYVKTAVAYILKNTPIGAYAVNDISYEIGTNQGETVIAFQIDYLRGKGEIMGIKQAEDMDTAWTYIKTALSEYAPSVVFRVESYTATDISQLVSNFGNENPDVVMEQPDVRTSVYPDNGTERIVEVQFTYQTSREDLQNMQKQVEPVFTSAELYVQQTAQKETYAQIYAFLMERNEYTLNTSITPAYSLLHHGVGDSRAFANVYGAMCRRVGLKCQTISGTRNGEPWSWNVVRYSGKNYHVDLLACRQQGKFRMLTDKEMEGYVWDYSAF